MTRHRSGRITAISLLSPLLHSAHLENIEIRHLADSLWRHVIDSSDLLIPLNVDRIIRNSLRDTEINNLQPPLDQDKIRGLEIGMDYVF